MGHAKKKVSKASRNYFYNLFSILPFIFLLFTGIIALRYHGGAPYETMTLGLDGHIWLLVHRITALVNIPIIIIHLLLHAHWFKMLVTLHLKGKNSGMNITLFSIFSLCVLTGLLAWLVFEGKPLDDVLREVHNKLGLMLIFFFIIHLSNYFRWIKNMTRKHLGRKKTAKPE